MKVSIIRRHKCRFPGLDCPGLIEAGFCGQKANDAGGFPGLDCPGLIEAPPLALRLAAVDVVFRGLIAPASLKQQWQLKDLMKLVGFSGA